MKTKAKSARRSYKVNVATTEQARSVFDSRVKSSLGITATTFIKNYRAGKYDREDDCRIKSLLMLLPFTGYSATYGNKQSR